MTGQPILSDPDPRLPPDDNPGRYRAVVIQDGDGKWLAAVVLFGDEYLERHEHDCQVEEWCPHRHRTPRAAVGCVPLMRRIARQLNAKLETTR